MTPQEKRRAIIQAIAEKTRQDGIEINISSPAVKYFYVGSKSGTKHSFEADKIDERALGIVENTVAEFTQSTYLKREAEETPPIEKNAEDEFQQLADDAQDYENLSLREFKRMKKEQQKEEKDQMAEERRLNKIRRDAHKRGFDTTILMQFEDPEELYEMSDEQIKQIQAAGYINEDGFYDFVFPEDAGSLMKERLTLKQKLTIAALIFLGLGVLTWFFFSSYTTILSF